MRAKGPGKARAAGHVAKICKPRRIVVDASVARSAGGEHAVFPVSRHCRDFLMTMLGAGHHAVFTPAVRAEWKQHQSRFARQWLTMMVARKRLSVSDPGEDAALRGAFEQATATPSERIAMLKDAHLVEAANATDRTVASLDDKVRALLAAAAKRVAVLRELVWVNPGHQEEGSTDWLQKGAPVEKHRLLTAWRSEATP